MVNKTKMFSTSAIIKEKLMRTIKCHICTYLIVAYVNKYLDSIQVTDTTYEIWHLSKVKMCIPFSYILFKTLAQFFKVHAKRL